MVYPILMKDRADAEKVCEEVTKANLHITISCGSTILDPRSILGLFTLIGRKAMLVAPDGCNPKTFLELVKKMNVSD